nr:MAG TPA: hypothetical protein [Microviridae sp.]
MRIWNFICEYFRFKIVSDIFGSFFAYWWMRNRDY